MTFIFNLSAIGILLAGWASAVALTAIGLPKGISIGIGYGFAALLDLHFRNNERASRKKKKRNEVWIHPNAGGHFFFIPMWLWMSAIAAFGFGFALLHQ